MFTGMMTRVVVVCIASFATLHCSFLIFTSLREAQQRTSPDIFAGPGGRHLSISTGSCYHC